VTPSVTQTAQNVSSSSGLRVWNDVAVGVSGTVSLGNQIGINNFPATQSVTGTLGFLSGTVQVWSEGPLPVSGTVSVQGAAAGTLAPVQVWNEGLVGVSGSMTIGTWGTNVTASIQGVLGQLAGTVQVWSEGALPVSGSVSLLPTTTAANAATFTGSMGQLPGGALPGVIKASAGTLYKVWVTNRSTSSVYLQLFNTATPPAANAVPLAAYQVFSASFSGGNPNLFPEDLIFDATPFGIAFSSGIAIGLSSANNKYVPVSDVGSGVATFWDFSAMYF
jgi:hypothetical protein